MTAAVRSINPIERKAADLIAGAVTAGKPGVCDMQAEEYVLAMVLTHDMLEHVRDLMPSGEPFSSGLYRRAYDAALVVHDRVGTVDVISVATHLRDADREGDSLELFARYRNQLADLLDRVPVLTIRMLRDAATRIRSRWVQRRLGHLAITLEAKAYDRSESVEDLLSAGLTGLQELADDVTTEDEGDTQLETAKRLAVAMKGKPKGIITGMTALDDLMLGLHAKQVTLIAARTSVGKSLLAQQLCIEVAKNGHGVYYAPLEMTRESMAARGASYLGRINSRWLYLGAKLPVSEARRLPEAIEEFRRLPWFTRGQQRGTVEEIYLEAKRQKMKFAAAGKTLRVVVVDHVGLLRPPKELMAAPRSQQLGHISRALRVMADELDVHVMALVQINREGDRGDLPPLMKHLKDSGDLEQDADTIIIVHRRRLDDGTFADEPGKVILAKNRVQGETGAFAIFCEPQYMRFTPIDESRSGEDSAHVF